MTTLNIGDLLNDMVGAAKQSFGEKWPTIKDLATLSLRNISQNFVDIEILKLKGTMTEEQAKLLVDMQKKTPLR